MSGQVSPEKTPASAALTRLGVMLIAARGNPWSDPCGAMAESRARIPQRRQR